MIARIWRGWAPQERAGDYQRHYETEVSEHLRAVSGFRGAQLLRRDEGGEVVFTSITWFTDLASVRGFAGDDYEQAVVEEAAQAALTRWDKRVEHHEVALAVQLRRRPDPRHRKAGRRASGTSPSVSARSRGVRRPRQRRVNLDLVAAPWRNVDNGPRTRRIDPVTTAGGRPT